MLRPSHPGLPIYLLVGAAETRGREEVIPVVYDELDPVAGGRRGARLQGARRGP